MLDVEPEPVAVLDAEGTVVEERSDPQQSSPLPRAELAAAGLAFSDAQVGRPVGGLDERYL